jgi:endonuclease G
MKYILAVLMMLLASNSYAASCPATSKFGNPLITTPTTAKLVGVCHKAYYVVVSQEVRTPLFCAETVTKDLTTERFERDDRFKADPSVPKDIQSSLKDFVKAKTQFGEPVARGHLCPYDNFSGDEQAGYESFYLSNMMVQSSGQNSGIWAQIEELVRKYNEKYGDVYVVSGPVFDKHPYYTVGDNKVAVPDRTYKVVMIPALKKSFAFLVPNQTQKNKRPVDFVVSQNEVESATGINFFPKLSGYNRISTLPPLK